MRWLAVGAAERLADVPPPRALRGSARTRVAVHTIGLLGRTP
jgi:hypothetical protein